METEKTMYLFIHLPKTAGTSMRNLLERNYNSDELLYVYQESPGVWLDTIKEYDDEKINKIRMMYGHFHFGMHELLNGHETKYITMVRDPIQRVISTYYHYKTAPNIHRENILSTKMDIVEFVTSEKFLETDNAMVRMISGVDKVPFGGCTKKIYKLAINNINKYFSEVLVMEEMSESIVRLQNLLGIDDVVIERDNVNKMRERDVINDEAIDVIRKLNQYDVMLYNYILRRYKMTTPVDNIKSMLGF